MDQQNRFENNHILDLGTDIDVCIWFNNNDVFHFFFSSYCLIIRFISVSSMMVVINQGMFNITRLDGFLRLKGKGLIMLCVCVCVLVCMCGFINHNRFPGY